MSNRIKQIRYNLGITQAALAKAIRTTVMSVSQWERGIRHISPEFAIRLARYATAKGLPTTLDDIYEMPKKKPAVKKAYQKTID